MINEDPFVRGAVMFGRGKFQNGVLIEPTEDFQIDPTDVKQLEAYRNKIWYVNSVRVRRETAQRNDFQGRRSSVSTTSRLSIPEFSRRSATSIHSLSKFR